MPRPTPDIEALIAAEPLDMRAAIEAVGVLAGGTESMLIVLRHELERAEWHDADPDADPASIGRAAAMERLLGVAECDARSVRSALELLSQRIAGPR